MRNLTRIKESTRVTHQTARPFLRRYAKHIALDELDLIPRVYGGNVVFYYGEDKILKVAKNGQRAALLKEAKISQYLNAQQLSVVFPEPLEIHPKGFYVVFSRLDGTAWNPDMLAGLSASQLSNIVQRLCEFLVFLHNHSFPDEVLQHIPKGTDPFAVHLHRVRRKVEFIKEHSGEFDVAGWSERLDRLEGALEQRWAVMHCDLTMGHIYALQDDPEQFGIIDFADAHIHDPAVDLIELAIELYSDLPEDGVLASQIVELLVQHYPSDDKGLAEKVEFGLLDFQIGRARRQVRSQLRQAQASLAH